MLGQLEKKCRDSEREKHAVVHCGNPNSGKQLSTQVQYIPLPHYISTFSVIPIFLQSPLSSSYEVSKLVQHTYISIFSIPPHSASCNAHMYVFVHISKLANISIEKTSPVQVAEGQDHFGH